MSKREPVSNPGTLCRRNKQYKGICKFYDDIGIQIVRDMLHKQLTLASSLEMVPMWNCSVELVTCSITNDCERAPDNLPCKSKVINQQIDSLSRII